MNAKIKYYLRGLGTGIIITTLVLSIAFATRGKSGSNSSDELLKNEGTGKVTSESSTEESSKEKKTTKKENSKKETTKKETTKKETTKKETTKKETTKKETTEKTTKKETTTEEVTTEEVTTEEAATQEPTTKKSQSSGETVEISIYSGMTSEEFCENLKQAGIIEDANDFNWYLNDNGYIRRIQVGTFTINKGDDYYAIAQKISR